MDQITQEFQTAVNAPVAASAEVTTCRTCAASIALDQRYCLSCGERRADSRVPFAKTLGAPPAAATAATAPVAAKAAISPGLAAAVVCLAVLFLGTGVLVGRSAGNGNAPVAAAAPQVITVPAGGATADTAAGGAAAGKAKGKAKAAATADKPTGPAPVATAADKAAVAKSDKCSTPEECSKASLKIPNKVVTSGKQVAPDGKPAGGGTAPTGTFG